MTVKDVFGLIGVVIMAAAAVVLLGIFGLVLFCAFVILMFCGVPLEVKKTISELATFVGAGSTATDVLSTQPVI